MDNPFLKPPLKKLLSEAKNNKNRRWKKSDLVGTLKNIPSALMSLFCFVYEGLGLKKKCPTVLMTKIAIYDVIF